jgi:hypothetical protein
MRCKWYGASMGEMRSLHRIVTESPEGELPLGGQDGRGQYEN